MVTKARGVAGDGGNALSEALSRGIAPGFVPGREYTKMSAADELIVVKGKD